MSDATINSIESVLLPAVLGAWLLLSVLWLLRRSRPHFNVLVPIAAGFGMRLSVIGALSATGIAQSLRGGDEIQWLADARALAHTPFSSDAFTHAMANTLHVWTFAVQIKLADLTESGMRVTQVVIATAGILLVAAAVHDLAGARAARLLAWVMAFEPASLFFSGLLHKEALMTLAGGMLVLGSTKVWKRLEPNGFALIVAGSLIGTATRQYAGLFLVAAGVIVLLHAGLVHSRASTARSLPVLLVAIVVVVLALPAVLQASSPSSLASLQQSQNANTSDNSNLRLESVDYSTRDAIITNLPTRIFDITFKPYPWQLSNTSQRLGLLGTSVALATLWLLLRASLRSWGQIWRRSGPMIYVLLALLVAYSLSVGNAGTGFRYRTHLILFAIALTVVLREHARRPAPGRARRSPARQSPRLSLAR